MLKMLETPTFCPTGRYSCWCMLGIHDRLLIDIWQNIGKMISLSARHSVEHEEC